VATRTAASRRPSAAGNTAPPPAGPFLRRVRHGGVGVEGTDRPGTADHVPTSSRGSSVRPKLSRRRLEQVAARNASTSRTRCEPFSGSSNRGSSTSISTVRARACDARPSTCSSRGSLANVRGAPAVTMRLPSSFEPGPAGRRRLYGRRARGRDFRRLASRSRVVSHREALVRPLPGLPDGEARLPRAPRSRRVLRRLASSRGGRVGCGRSCAARMRGAISQAPAIGVPPRRANAVDTTSSTRRPSCAHAVGMRSSTDGGEAACHTRSRAGRG